jgi:hypothetical protein
VSLRETFERFAGRGENAVTVPTMDGALRPNERLETEAQVVAQLDDCDNLVWDGSRWLVSSEASVYRLSLTGELDLHRTYESAVTCLAVLRDGRVVAGLDAGVIQVDGQESIPVPCPTAVVQLDDGELLVAIGSSENPPSQWKRDLMQRQCSGRIARVGISDGHVTDVQDGLAWPSGLAVDDERGTVVVAEAWRHRLVELQLDGSKQQQRELVADLPGYPGRLTAGPDGTRWLCIFAPRSQLVEFVLRERAYRIRMMREIDPAYWIAPDLRSGDSFLEPFQGGAMRALGVLKPWAPTRSYGLVVQLDPHWRPVDSWHSRTGGSRHGVTSASANGTSVIASCRGTGQVLELTGVTA